MHAGFLYKSTDLGDSWTALPILPVAGRYRHSKLVFTRETRVGDDDDRRLRFSGKVNRRWGKLDIKQFPTHDIAHVRYPRGAEYEHRRRSRASMGGQAMTRQVLRSTNMGNTWSAINVPVATDLQAVSFVNSQLGYASGTNSQVVKTTDAGLTWAPVTPPSATSYTLQAVEFIDANTGWVFANFGNVPGGNIFKTTDGGTTWSSANDWDDGPDCFR